MSPVTLCSLRVLSSTYIDIRRCVLFYALICSRDHIRILYEYSRRLYNIQYACWRIVHEYFNLLSAVTKTIGHIVYINIHDVYVCDLRSHEYSCRLCTQMYTRMTIVYTSDMTSTQRPVRVLLIC